jgi:excisionase family DNA binding protein
LETQEILTVDEAAARLRISKWSLYNLIRSQQIRTITVGRRRRLVPAVALTECVARLLEEAA